MAGMITAGYMEFERGCLVVCEDSFEPERRQYPQYPYPHKGDVLTVSGKGRHFNTQDLMLTFEELRNIIPFPLVAEFFTIVQTAQEGKDIMEKVSQILKK